MFPPHLAKPALRAALAALLMTLAACATPPPADDPEAVAEFKELNDPFEPTNRAIFDFNDVLYTNFFRPVALGYRDAVPEFARARINDFLSNLRLPVVFANDVLQGNLPSAGETIERLALNTTFGVGGIMDVATPMGVPRQDADFGQTLAVWGVGEGPYLVLPVIGPSNPRDGVGYLVDSFADPLDQYLQNSNMSWVSEIRFGVTVVTVFEANVGVLDDIKRSSMDYYGAMRSAYRQRRAAQINEATNPSVGWVRFMPHWSWSNLGIQ
ncbi:MAG TPA: VacJ family lipoprotein [Magnetospirillaceae bacterium]|nr:VacJ family lipoprotein [Magnetospirillaceae bacterium]